MTALIFKTEGRHQTSPASLYSEHYNKLIVQYNDNNLSVWKSLHHTSHLVNWTRFLHCPTARTKMVDRIPVQKLASDTSFGGLDMVFLHSALSYNQNGEQNPYGKAWITHFTWWIGQGFSVSQLQPKWWTESLWKSVDHTFHLVDRTRFLCLSVTT